MFRNWLSIGIGALLLIFRKRFAAQIRFQNKARGLRFGDWEERTTNTISVIVGSPFLILGFLGLLGVIDFKQ